MRAGADRHFREVEVRVGANVAQVDLAKFLNCDIYIYLIIRLPPPMKLLLFGWPVIVPHLAIFLRYLFTLILKQGFLLI